MFKNSRGFSTLLMVALSVAVESPARAEAPQEVETPAPVDSVIRLPKAGEKPRWASETILRLHLDPAIATPEASTLDIHGTEMLEFFSERLLNHRAYMQEWKLLGGLTNANGGSYREDLMKERSKTLSFSAYALATDRLLSHLAKVKNETQHLLSEKRVDYAVRSTLLRLNYPDVAPGTLIAATNEEMYPRLVEQYGNSPRFSMKFDWMNLQDRLPELLAAAKREERLEWTEVSANLGTLPSTYPEFHSRMREALLDWAGLKQKALFNTYGGKWAAPIKQAANSPTLQKRTFESIRADLWGAKVSALMISAPPEAALLGLPSGKDMKTAQQLVKAALAQDASLDRANALKTGFSDRYLDLVVKTIKDAGLKLTVTRVDHRDILSFGSLLEGSSSKILLEKTLLESVRQDLLSGRGEGSLVQGWTRTETDPAYLWSVVEKKAELPFTHPRAKVQVKASLQWSLEGLWTALSLEEAFNQNAVEVVGRTGENFTSGENWAWPNLEFNPSGIAKSLILPVARPSHLRGVEDAKRIAAGERSLQLKDMEWINAFDRRLFDAALATP